MSNQSVCSEITICEKEEIMNETSCISVKSVDEFNFDELQGLTKRDREYILNRFSPKEIVFWGRAVAHQLATAAKERETCNHTVYPTPKYMQKLAASLDRAGFIRHDLDVMTLRIMWMYQDCALEKRKNSAGVEPSVQGFQGSGDYLGYSDWFGNRVCPERRTSFFNEAYETESNLSEVQIAKIIEAILKNDFDPCCRNKDRRQDPEGFWSRNEFWAEQIIRWYGLDRRDVLPESFSKKSLPYSMSVTIMANYDMTNVFYALPEMFRSYHELAG